MKFDLNKKELEAMQILLDLGYRVGSINNFIAKAGFNKGLNAVHYNYLVTDFNFTQYGYQTLKGALGKLKKLVS